MAFLPALAATKVDASPSEAKGDNMYATGNMRYYVVSNAESVEYTVKYGLPGEISLPVATTQSRGIAERIAKAMNKSEATGKTRVWHG